MVIRNEGGQGRRRYVDVMILICHRPLFSLKIESGTTFPFKEYDMQFITEEGKARMIEALKEGPGYMVGGREHYWQNHKNKAKK